MLLAGLAAAATVRFNTFTPWGTDPAEYVTAAHRWDRGAVVAPAPLALWAPWTDDGHRVVPLGARPGLERGTMVSQYPLGLPVLMAAALRIAGDVGPYLVAPFFAAVLVWSTFLVANAFAGAWAGLLAAALVATDPVMLGIATGAMSDVPATALWVLAWAMSLRSGSLAAAAAGSAAAMAVTIRPNLAPLALVPAALLFAARRREGRRLDVWRPLLVFLALAAVGPALVMWSQQALYGGATTPGYLGWREFYARGYIATNVRTYSRLALDVHSPAVVVALLAPVWLLRPRWAGAVDAPGRRQVRAAVAVAAVNVAAYLAYTPYSEPEFLRFLLPAVAATFVLVAGATVALVRQAGRRPWAAIVVLPAAAILVWHLRAVPDLSGPRQRQRHVALMGEYLRAVLPERAVLLSRLQGGAMHFYTGRPMVRLDLVAAGDFDRIVDDLLAAGHEPMLVLSDLEEAVGFGTYFTTSRFRGLDWAPRARAPEAAGQIFFALTDQARAARGERLHTDILRATP